MSFSKLLFCLASLQCIAASSRQKTMVEHIFGMDHNQIDDGAEYVEWREASQDDPTFAQGYFLKDAAAGPDNAKCLDGTPPLYYHRPGTGDGANKWYIHQEGGGWCGNPANCLDRAHSSLGSTINDTDSRSLNSGYFSIDPTQNPLMYNWNAVFLRYCDGASVAGDLAVPAVVGTQSINFRGRAILDAEIASLLQDRGLKSATDVVVSGCSAGGLATFLHCDKWAAALSTATGNTAKVVCMPDSGFFVDYEGYGAMMRNIADFQAVTAAGVNADCFAAHTATNDTEVCMLAQYSSQHIKTPTFPLQSQFDSWQYVGELSNPTDAEFNEYGRNLTTILSSDLLAQKQHGAFLDSCFSHCGNWGGPIIDTSNAGQALNLW